MGLFSTIGNIANKITNSSIVKTIEKIVAPSAVLLNTAKKVITKEITPQTAKAEVVSTLKTQAVAGALGASLINPASTLAAAKTLIPKSALGKIGGAAAATATIGAAIRQPAAVGNAITSTPTALANFGGNVADLAVNPSLDNLTKIGKENPLITTAVGVIGGVLGAKTLTSVANIVTTERNTAALEDLANNSTNVLPTASTSGNGSVPATISTNEGKPIVPNTETIQLGQKKKRKAGQKRKTKSNGNITQSIKINFDNDKYDNKTFKKRVY
jgi:hypothetical protein